MLSCTSAFSQSVSVVSIEDVFLNAQAGSAKKVANGVYEVIENNGSITRHSFGTEGARYDLAEAQTQLRNLQNESQKRQLTDAETQLRSDLSHRILDLKNLTSGAFASKSTNFSTNAAGGACGVVGEIVAIAPSSSAPGAAIAISNQGAGFGAGPSYTFNANIIFYTNSAKTSIIYSETAPTKTGPSGRATAFGYNGSGSCYAVATASVTSTQCSSPNNYASVSQSAACL